MSPMAWMLVLMLLPLAASASSALVLKPDCQARCGDLVVPYPFGIGAGCFRPGFEIACDRNTTPFLPDVTFKGHTPAEPVRVLNLNVTPRAQVRVMLPVAHECVDTARKVTARFDGKLTFNKWRVYRISNTANELFVLGCDTLIYAASRPRRSRFRHATSDPYSSGCVAYCNSAQDARDRRCNSIGCCHVNISRLLNNTKMWFEKWSRTRVDSTRPCDYAFIVEKNGYVFETAHLKRKPEPDPDKRWSMPLWLDWAIRNRSNSMWCPQAVKTREYACVSKHSDCANSTNGKGYICKCSNGYEGTPYLIDGCTASTCATSLIPDLTPVDINECKKPELYPCFGKCTNKDGSFECTCSKGHEGNASKKHGCVKSIKTGLIIGLSVSSGPTILILLLTTKIIIRKLKNQKEQKLRQKFFNQNRGQLLQKLVSHRSDIAERMIIPLRELEKATNKFHPTRKLGGGGHGTVYKGILSDLHVVAIKRSNIEVKSEINEFINEVSILSQINHRNIVKLFGCCLETEVPLLAYEFISNGTLCDYLHKKPLRSLPWQEILRIALEIGRALSYLHSGLSVPIIHRDIKSTNILLDDALTAKVCDFGASRYIPRDKTTITTVVQGMLGYLDPTYFYCGRLTEKSDVYSFGVILVELLTRKMPITRRSSSGDGLVAQFVELLAKGKLVDILDPQVMEEGGSQAEVVASLAMSCTKLRAEERPTMRSVEMTLEALQGPKERFRVQDGTYEGSYSAMRYTSPRRSTSLEKTSRQYSQEEEFVLSASYPR
ncbi:wall-associated receptor kinase 5-like [Triticum dicoccoides]|uniref:wall-associated receptor kinase 5-like n=1 Tax=Triticum dicoccoides TaxID=85692 RepID=UPI00188E55B3|nr:wall-associated receptor kinase 5-like [Triticum dicoccoides]